MKYDINNINELSLPDLFKVRDALAILSQYGLAEDELVDNVNIEIRYMERDDYDNPKNERDIKED